MTSTCIFEFDRPEPVFYSGENIYLRATLNLAYTKEVHSIYVSFEGTACVSWERREWLNKLALHDWRTDDDTVHSSDSYVMAFTKLCRKEQLPTGQHIFELCLPLPAKSPNSCIAKYGRVFYELGLVVEYPEHRDDEYKRQVIVMYNYNLNWYPEILAPLKFETVSEFCSWPIKGGAVFTILSLPCGGYVPGQMMNFQLEIDNRSQGHDVNNVVVQFIQTTKYTVSFPKTRRTEDSKVLIEYGPIGEVLRYSKRVINDALFIHNMPPTTRYKTLIDVSYHLVVSIKTGGVQRDSTLSVPIIIGTKPQQNSVEGPKLPILMPTDKLPKLPTLMPNVKSDDDKPPSYEKCKSPPGFVEAVSGAKPGSDCPDDIVPRYPICTNFVILSASTPDNTNTPFLTQKLYPYPPVVASKGPNVNETGTGISGTAIPSIAAELIARKNITE
ncbi:arrestin domain-containing protein 1-like [Scaptodrosophila lebanonensis]|uniref:Arrestin domain-containing protein 1-like n=1 Tax=Drosophila lebanonensis TaxID=7225 RepID=A0A6J2TDZ8_DROLE|nr:arrestin domain-containing protein 1-like [Scaptodrosophila lebanonensis]